MFVHICSSINLFDNYNSMWKGGCTLHLPATQLALKGNLNCLIGMNPSFLAHVAAKPATSTMQ